MRQIFIISLLVCKSFLLLGQSTLSDSLLYYEYTYFKNSDTAAKQQLLLKKINLYLSEKITGPEVFKEIRRVQYAGFTDRNQKTNFLWDAIILSYLNNEADYARYYLDEYESLKNDTSFAFNLMAILVNKYTDTSDVNKRIETLSRKDSLFKGLHCFMDMAKYNRKHLNFYLISSLIVPGSGTAMNGYLIKGLVSLALTAGSVYGIVKLVEYGLYANAILWGTGVGLKFYAGNVKLTEQSFYKAEARKKNKLTMDCELKLEKLLEKYPLTLLVL